MTQKTIDLVDIIYPIGSIYISTNSTNPSTLFGGTWQKIEDKFLLASGSTYSLGSTGGSADAVIVSHSHKAIGYTNTSGSGSNRRNPTGYNASGIDGTLDTETVGESGTGKNMPPYLTVNVWERTA